MCVSAATGDYQARCRRLEGTSWAASVEVVMHAMDCRLVVPHCVCCVGGEHGRAVVRRCPWHHARAPHLPRYGRHFCGLRLPAEGGARPPRVRRRRGGRFARPPAPRRPCACGAPTRGFAARTQGRYPTLDVRSPAAAVLPCSGGHGHPCRCCGGVWCERPRRYPVHQDTYRSPHRHSRRRRARCAVHLEKHSTAHRRCLRRSAGSRRGGPPANGPRGKREGQGRVASPMPQSMTADLLEQRRAALGNTLSTANCCYPAGWGSLWSGCVNHIALLDVTLRPSVDAVGDAITGHLHLPGTRLPCS